MIVRTFVRGAAVLAALALLAADPAHGALTAYLDPVNRDATCDACTDFYRYANGGWLERHPIPADKSYRGIDDDLYENNLVIIRRGLEAQPRSVAGTFYAACMDTAAIEAAGASPLHDELARIAAATDAKSVVAEAARLDAAGSATAFIGFGPQADPSDSRRQIADVAQGGLTLPDRDFYARTDAESVKTRTALVDHAKRVFGLLGEDDATAATDAATVLRVESALAKPQVPTATLRDPKVTTNPATRDRLARWAPGVDWRGWYAAHGITSNAPSNADVPSYLRALDAYLASAPAADLATYLRFRYVHAQEPYLARAFEDERFRFDAVLSGQAVQRPRWKRCVGATDAHLVDLVGQLFVARAFPPSAKAAANGMVRDLRAALAADISSLTWMSAQTKARALDKLTAMAQKIGYPDRWRSYAGLHTTASDYFGDHVAASRLDAQREWAKIGKATPRWEWGMGAQLINAQYDPLNNDITFPAAILLPPYYDAGDDQAMNYGAIGAVIGHEITHGFDDQGRLYDRNGNLKEWWTTDDARRYDRKARCIVDEFDRTVAIGNVHYVGKQDSGEAIADLGGVKIAYDAFERWQAANPRRTIGGFTPEQRFFIAYASSWAANQRAAAMRTQAQSDPHPLNRDRVDVTLRNFPAFARAFGCARSTAMVKPPARVCSVW